MTFVSEVVMNSDGFDEFKTITYGDRGNLKFETIETGHIAQSAVEGLNHGSLIWNITGGDGEFSRATGLITFNFTFSAEGDVVDNQYGRLSTP